MRCEMCPVSEEGLTCLFPVWSGGGQRGLVWGWFWSGAQGEVGSREGALSSVGVGVGVGGFLSVPLDPLGSLSWGFGLSGAQRGLVWSSLGPFLFGTCRASCWALAGCTSLQGREVSESIGALGGTRGGNGSAEQANQASHVLPRHPRPQGRPPAPPPKRAVFAFGDSFSLEDSFRHSFQ